MMLIAGLRRGGRGLLLRQPVLKALPESRHQNIRPRKRIGRMGEEPRRSNVTRGGRSICGRMEMRLAIGVPMENRIRLGRINPAMNVRRSFAAVLDQGVQCGTQSDHASEQQAGGKIGGDNLSKSQLHTSASRLPPEGAIAIK